MLQILWLFIYMTMSSASSTVVEMEETARPLAVWT
jgi:hypothetical protein